MLPLAGVRVLDVSQVMAGPFCCMLLGDMGAEGLTFVPAHESPSGEALLIVANEVSGSTTVYEVEPARAR